MTTQNGHPNYRRAPELRSRGESARGRTGSESTRTHRARQTSSGQTNGADKSAPERRLKSPFLPPVTPRPNRKKRRVIALLVVLLIALVGFGIYRRDKIVQYAKDLFGPEATTVMSTATTSAARTTASPTVLTPVSTLEDPREEALIEDFFGPLPVRERHADFDHFKIRGLYIADGSSLDYYLDLARGTEINAFILDVKESYGLLYKSEVPLAVEMGASVKNNDLRSIIEKCHAENIRVIARIVCFKDNVLIGRRPDLSICNRDGEQIYFPLEANNAFADPYKTEVWDYLIDIAKEVIGFGADEIQFDYVRFPSGYSHDGSDPWFGKPEEIPYKYQVIDRFLQTAAIEIQDNLNVPVGADIFSTILTSRIDGELIGQYWARLGQTGINNICPMIYPSHYANSSNHYSGNGVGSYIGDGFFAKPDLEPYEVVYNSLLDGKRHMESDEFAYIRPYLQAFTAAYLPNGYFMHYGIEEIQAQINACVAHGYDEWILWNVELNYPDLSPLTTGELSGN